jgi:glycosyltransferase involved in cell wall biosynthesis
MKTVFICHNYKDESFASMSYFLGNHLTEEGYRVVFISKDPYFEEQVVKTIGNGELILTSWPSKVKSTGIKDFSWFFKLYKKYLPEVIIGHHNGSITSNITAKFVGGSRTRKIDYHHINSKAIIEAKGKMDLKLRFFFLRKSLFYRLFCDQVICPSRHALEDLEGFFKCKKGKVILNPLPDRIEKSKEKRHKELVFGFLGRLDRNKNVLALMDAFSKLNKEYSGRPIRLKIAGGGELEKEVQKRSEALNSINYLGSIPYSEVNDFLQSLDFLIIPSKSDVLPTVGIEALRNGIPIIITPQVGLVDFLVEGEEFLLTQGDANSLFMTMKKVQELSSEDYSFLKTKARGAYERNFQLDTYIQSMKMSLNL